MKYKTLLPVLFLLSVTSCQSNLGLNQLTKPSNNKISTTNNVTLSEKTYNSYVSFAKKFTSLMMEVNNSANEQSLGISIPDAYICFAITGAISNDAARNDVLSYLELDNVSELRTSVKELVDTLGTLYKTDNKLYGGYNLNSVWLNPDYVSLVKDKDEELYYDLEHYYDATMYFEALTNETANQYLRDYGLKNLPTPKIELPGDPCALNAMSVFYCLDYFDNELIDTYKKQYQSGNHKMDYSFGSTLKKVDYIGKSQIAEVYENENFYGSNMRIGLLNADFFLPNDKNAMPSSILNDVLNKNYKIKKGSIKYPGEESFEETNFHDVSIKAPYFSLDNKIALDREALSRILPVITKNGAGERLVKANDGSNLYLDYIMQFSKMKFNYEGFYSCSVTISGERATSAGTEYKRFELNLDHPYLFEINKNVRVDNNRHSIPIVIGEIVDPIYKD